LGNKLAKNNVLFLSEVCLSAASLASEKKEHYFWPVPGFLFR